MVRTSDGDTEFFGIVAGVLQEDTLAPYFFITYLDNILWTSIDLIKENGFARKKSKKQMISNRKLNRRKLRIWSTTFCKTAFPTAVGGFRFYENTNKI